MSQWSKVAWFSSYDVVLWRHKDYTFAKNTPSIWHHRNFPFLAPPLAKSWLRSSSEILFFKVFELWSSLFWKKPGKGLWLTFNYHFCLLILPDRWRYLILLERFPFHTLVHRCSSLCKVSAKFELVSLGLSIDCIQI